MSPVPQNRFKDKIDGRHADAPQLLLQRLPRISLAAYQSSAKRLYPVNQFSRAPISARQKRQGHFELGAAGEFATGTWSSERELTYPDSEQKKKRRQTKACATDQITLSTMLYRTPENLGSVPSAINLWFQGQVVPQTSGARFTDRCENAKPRLNQMPHAGTQRGSPRPYQVFTLAGLFAGHWTI